MWISEGGVICPWGLFAIGKYLSLIEREQFFIIMQLSLSDV